MKILIVFLMGLIGLNAVAATHVQFQLTDPSFGISQTTNRTIIVQSESGTASANPTVLLPFQLRGITDSNGVCTFSNLYGSAIGGWYRVTIPAPPQRADFDIWVQSTNLGLIQASTIRGVFGANTYPSSAFAWAADVSDARYAASSNTLGSYATIVQLNSTSNNIVALIPSTNGFVTASITNGFATTNFAKSVTNGFTAIVFSNITDYATPSQVTNIVNGLANTNVFTLVTVTNVANGVYSNNLAGYVNSSVTNGLASTNYVGVNYYLKSNPSNFVTASVTNGLATIGYVQTATNGLVTSAVTNGLATTNFVLGLGYVTSTVTNGLATTQFVNSAVSTLASTNYVLGLTNYYATINYVSNLVQVTSNGISISSGSNFIQNLNGNGTNTTIVTGRTIAATNFNVLSANGGITFPNGDSIKEFSVAGGFGGETGIAIGLSNGVPLYESYSFLAGAYNDISAILTKRINGGTVLGVSNTLNPDGNFTTILGGLRNQTYGEFGFIGGGAYNNIGNGGSYVSSYNSILGGLSNSVNANVNYSLAAGWGANPAHSGSFVWNDNGATFSTTQTNQFLIHAINGVGINTNNPGTNALNVSGNVNATSITVNGIQVLTNAVSSSVAAGTNITVQTNGLVYTINANSQTNNFTSLVYSNPSVFLYTNALPALTNAFATLVKLTNYAYPTSNPSLFVTSAITNGLATTNYINPLVVTNFQTNVTLSGNLSGKFLISNNSAILFNSKSFAISNNVIYYYNFDAAAGVINSPLTTWNQIDLSFPIGPILNYPTYSGDPYVAFPPLADSAGRLLYASGNVLAYNGQVFGDGSQLTSLSYNSITNPPAIILTNDARYLLTLTNGSYYVASTNGSAYKLRSLDNFGLGTKTNFVVSTNVIGINGAGNSGANGTYQLGVLATWTNSFNSTYTIVLSAGTYYIQSNAVSLYSASNPTNWSIVSGSVPAPQGDFGSRWNMNGVALDGYVTSTNVTYQITNSIQTAKIQSTNILGGITTNISFPIVGVSTNTLYFTNGILMRVTQP